MNILQKLNPLPRLKAAFDRTRYLQSSIRTMEGAGTLGAKPWPFNYRLAVEQCQSWVYRCAMGNAQAAASIPLRLYVRNRSQRELKLLGYEHGTCAFQTRMVPRSRRKYLAGEMPHKPSALLRHKIASFGEDFVEVQDHPVLDVLRTANPAFNSFDLSVYRFLMLELTGNAYLHPVMDKVLDRPVELWPMPSHWVEMRPGKEQGELISGYVYGASYTEKQIFEVDEVLRFCYPNPKDLLYGMGKVEAAWSALALHHSERTMQKALFDNHARPDFLIGLEGASPDQVDRFGESIKGLLKGVRNAGKFLATNGKITAVPLAFPPDKLGSTEPVIEEIAGVFGYPITKLKGNDPNRANAETGDAGWMKDTILPMLRADEEALNQNGYIAMFGDGALVDDVALGYVDPVPANNDQQLRSSQVLVGAGITTINEDREERGLSPIDGGELARVNGVPLDVLGQPQTGLLNGLGGLLGNSTGANAGAAKDRSATDGGNQDETPPAAPAALDLARILEVAMGKTVELVRVQNEMRKSRGDAPGYQPANVDGKADANKACKSCFHLSFGMCHQFSFRAHPHYICDGWQVNEGNGKDCGTGAGGFQPGNDCAGEGGSGSQATERNLQSATRDDDGTIRMSDGSSAPENIQKLGIPPAWTDLKIDATDGAELLAQGKDKKGRVQSVYSDEHTMKQAAAKFARTKELAAKIEKIDAQNTENMKSSDPKVREAAAVSSLIRETGIRPGSERDTGADKQAYGATTLKSEHVKVGNDGSVTLEFVGKKGVSLNIPINNQATAKMLTERAAKGGKLFDVSDSELREYTKTLNGGKFKPKDFRTLKGTQTAIAEIKQMSAPTTQKEYKKQVRIVATQVSKRLGNTPTIALQSYIDPAVFSKWRIAG
jgi:DNA topoisomerase-1